MSVEEWQIEYHRLRRLGGGDYWAGYEIDAVDARSKISPYALGVADHRSLTVVAALLHNAPPVQCPFADGTPEKAEYNRGWDAFPCDPKGGSELRKRAQSTAPASAPDQRRSSGARRKEILG
jgi:hypothetical protein